MYTVIARKYRPQTFSEVVNQEHIKQTLRNAIEQKRIAHGYIFSGQRGTGKTTMARLLAKALNCVAGPAAEPCLKCDSCKEIAQSGAVDVIEIDAASNRGIDDIRSLRENTRYAPARDRYKFFIIDEAHQLTKEAWNALLKTLEEPPPHVIFVLCTTESHSIPATIASRCQTFAFHNLGFEETVKQLQHIATSEGITATEEALAVITLAAEGSLRDALSTLDQAIACCGDRLEGDMVRQLLGVAPAQALDEVVDAIHKVSAERMLALVDRLVREGHNLRNFCGQLCRHFRNLLVARTAGGSPQLLEASKAERERLAAQAALFTEEDLTRYLQILLRLFQDLHHSSQARFHTELGLLKLVHARRLISIEEVIGGLSSGGGTGPKLVAGSPGAGPGPRSSAAPPTPLERDQQRRSAPPPSGEFASQLIPRLEEKGRTLLAVRLEKAVSWEVTQDSVNIGFPVQGSNAHLPGADEQKLLAQLASEILGRTVSVRFLQVNEQAAVAPIRPAAAAVATAGAQSGSSMMSHPEVAEFLRQFPGATVEEPKRR